MAVKLPTRDSLGGLPGGRSGGLARVSVPSAPRVDVSGIANLGQGIGAVGNAAFALEDHAQKQDEFEVERRFQEFVWQQERTLDDEKRKVQPGQAREFPEKHIATYQESAKAFFKDIPDHLKPKYDQRLFGAEKSIYRAAAEYARTEQRRFATNSVIDATDNIYRPRAQATPTDNLDTVTGDLDRLIDANPDLTPPEKDELKRKARRAIGQSHLDALPPEQVGALSRGRSAPVTTEGLLRRFEGFREGAYWDVNAYRVGYGSDTVTLADGSIVKVTKDTKVTREDAERDLARRAREFSGVVERQVGPETWSALPSNVKAALTSVAYNYGSLPKTVVAAIATGDIQEIANSVRSLPANRSRRAQEADIILGAPGGPSALAALTEEDWQRAEGAAHTRQTRQAAAVAETFERHIIDASMGRGALPDRASIELDPTLDEPRRNALLRQHDQAAKEIIKYQNLKARFDDPNAGPFNPYDAEDKKGVDLIFQQLGGDGHALTAVVQRTGMVPKSVTTKLRGDLASNDPGRVETALQLVRSLSARNPQIWAGVEGERELESASVTFRHRVEDLGMTAKEAALKYVESQTPEYKAKVQARIKNEDINEIVKKRLSVDDLRSAFDDSWWPGRPAVGFDPKTRQAMYSDYVEHFRELYLENGDVDLSKSLAQKQLKRVWGVSKVNGSDVVMRYAPEKAPAYQGIENVSVKIADQAIAAIKEETGQDVTRAQLRLSPIPQGRTSMAFWRGEPPPYLLSWQDKNGVVHSLNPGRAFVADMAMLRAAQTGTREAEFLEEREYRDVARQPQPQIKLYRKEPIAVQRRRESETAPQLPMGE